MKNKSYYNQDLLEFYKFNVPLNCKILKVANSRFNLKQKYDYIILPDLLNQLDDIQKVIHRLKTACTPETRIILNFYNFLWSPLVILAEKLGLKQKQPLANWLNPNDVYNILALEGFEIIKKGKRFLFPIDIPFFSKFINKYIANLPLINTFCITNYIIARPLPIEPLTKSTVSIIIPARNEAGNIETLIKKLPKIGKHTEIIFIEGHSKDATFQKIKKVAKKYQNLDIKYAKQSGIGKGNAVRKGFAMAKGDILMILDADLSVEPKELVKFYSAIISGRGEFVNGSRLIYPMEKQAMRILNILGNKFFSVVFSWLLSQRIKDTLCGTKVISRKNYLKIAANRQYFGDFDPFGDFDLIFGAAKLNLKFIEIPVKYKARQYGETNIQRFKHGWLLLKMTLFASGKIKFV
ncbi:glycosyltransferase family 2 protein [Patescibacteria group bacterium]